MDLKFHTNTTESDSAENWEGAFAEVIIPLALPKNYTWSVPAHLATTVRVGCRVEVNLGKQKKYAGVIKRLHFEKPEFFEAKEILNVIDTDPIVFDQQLKLWEWMAAYYMCSEGEVMAAALPAHFKLSSETILVYNEEFGDDFSTLDHDEYLVGEALLIKKELRLTEVQQVLESSHVYPVINRLIHKKVCTVWEALRQSYSPRKETYVLLNPEYSNEDKLADLFNNWTRAPKQMELLLSYLHVAKTVGEVTKTELLKKSGASDAQLKGLVEKNILWTEKRSVDRLRYLPKDINIDFTLNEAQQKALGEVQEVFKSKQVCLLHGVTSSGKTLVYIKLIEEQIRKGKQVLYLLPEIALTSQIIRRLQVHFGGHIGIYHSRFTPNERVEIWNKVKSGELKIVLGARSAVFLPFYDLGLVVCDEEHDASFKQFEPAPRYNGRDASIFFASLFRANVLLGSATPSLESYHNATIEKYGLVELPTRYGDLEPPEIQFIDLKTIERKDRAKVMLSPPMVDAIRDTVKRHKQVILFQNRRGYTPYQVCNVCGWIPQCKHCDVSLTFHKFTNKLVCHYCGTGYSPVTICAACGNHDFVQRNFGTEKIEEQLQEVFPEARSARMDVDSVKGKNAHDILIQQFEKQKIDILVGTQMVVKGLDFDKVDLVGILDADGLLHFADFRVNERAFQLMEQVSGRAGRKEATGKVLVQTLNPSHPLLLQVKYHDYKAMFIDEMAKRKQFAYPPYTRIILLTFRHKLREVVEQASIRLTDSLKHKYGDYMIGPAEPVVNRVRNQYLIELLFKLPKDRNLIMQCKHDIFMATAQLHAEPAFRSVTVIPDVDVL